MRAPNLTVQSKPVILGGPPIPGAKARAPWPVHGAPERKALLGVLRSGKWWRGGTRKEMESSVTGAFEKAYARWHGTRHGMCVTNGTAALELALRAGGVEAGDEVIVPSLSFVVSATAAPLVGGVPVFADADPETYQMSADSIEALITRRTRAIVLVHYAGYPADLDRITKLARKHRLLLVEDCAHAQGSQWRGKGVGGWGDAGCFSFQMSKALAAGEGGIVLSNSDVLAEKIYSYHHLGRIESQGFYDFHRLAWNLRMTEWQGAILGEQLKRAKIQTLEKMRNAARLTRRLEEIGGLRALKADARITRRGYYFYVLRYDAHAFAGLPRKDFLAALHAEGLPVGSGYGRAIQHNPVFAEMRGRGGKSVLAGAHTPVADRLCAEEQLTIGHTCLLSRPLVDAFADAVERIKAHAPELAARAREQAKPAAKKKKSA
ncbi:MAG: DegT/DnrJ/EryC1/StrS family aminotransferase [Planctomycetota bacterium]|nr:DegT/DnrJ/EryC1/StrS family aminotransferase [Planctomycetota bacterium]